MPPVVLTHPDGVKNAPMAARTLSSDRPQITRLDCVLFVQGRVPDSLLCGLPELHSLRLPGESALTGAMTMLVGEVAEYAELHELLSRIVGQNLPILSASAQPVCKS